MVVGDDFTVGHADADSSGEDSGDSDDHITADQLLAGGPGAQLVSILTQLSASLGSESRFSRAVHLLRHDVSELRMQEQLRQDDEQAPPAVGVTLQQPEVRDSLGTMLRLLDDGVGGTARRDVSINLDERLLQDADWSPASQKAIENLLEVQVPVECADQTCAICLDTMSAMVLQMPCSQGHVFHRDCLLQWLSSRHSCPVCRHELEKELHTPTLPGELSESLEAV